MASRPSAIASSPLRMAPSSVRMASSVRPGSRLRAAWKREHQPLKTLQQRIVQLARDARPLVDALFQAHVELPLQLPDTELVRHPQHRQKSRPRTTRETTSSGSTPGRWRTPAMSPVSFHTPLLLEAITRKR